MPCHDALVLHFKPFYESYGRHSVYLHVTLNSWSGDRMTAASGR
jgi:hypothetical protein